MQPADLVRELRERAGLSVRALAEAAGVAGSTIHRIEQGRLRPTVELLDRITEAAGARLQVSAKPDSAVSLVGLAQAMREDLANGDTTWPVRRAAEFVHRFHHSDPDRRRRMIAARPPDTGDERWNAFVAALAEWLAVTGDVSTPTWAHEPDRYLGYGWWITSMRSMRAWEYAGSPVSFQIRGIYIHRDSLVNV
jgi:transcriptional regulator with XRE-family HTH domain